MKKDDETQSEKFAKIRQRIKDGYYRSEFVVEAIADSFIEEIETRRKVLTFKYE